MKIKPFVFITLFCLSINIYPQISGTVTNADNKPIEFANVALYETTDTLELKHGAVTDSSGFYKFTEDIPEGEYMLEASFLGYKTETTNITITQNSNNSINFILHPDETLLSELIVEGERPIMKVESGKLIYHIPTLLKNKTAANTYDALKEIPGIIEQNDNITLLGTNGVTILLNGQKTSMTYAQLMQLLKSIPVSMLEDVEIMYSAPPSYNIRGAAVNVILKQQSDEDSANILQGEFAGEFLKRKYTSGNGRASLVYQSKKTSVDALYSYANNKGFNKEDLTAEHSLSNGNTYNIKQLGESMSRRQMHNARLAMQHAFDNDDKVSISYTGMFNDASSNRIASTTITKQTNSVNPTVTNSETGSEGPSSLHNIKADYSFHFGLNLGADYTSYSDESDYRLTNTNLISSALAEKLTYQSYQNIRRIMFYANQTHRLNNNWELNYGFNYSVAESKNRSDAIKDNNVFDDATFDTKQNESIRNIFAGFSKSFSGKLSIQASLAMEYYKSTELAEGVESTLWNDIAWFPTFNLSYQHSPKHIFQLALSSDKTYPAYWSLNPNVYYISNYGVIHGNPHLRPMRNYSLGLTYIYKQKYIIRPYINHVSDFFVQLPYQSPDELQQIFKEQNYTFRQSIGLLGVLPFTIGNRFSSHLIANVMYNNEKDDDFYDIPFHRKAFFGLLQMNNDIMLSSKPNIKMNVSGFVTTPSNIQGIYDLGSAANLSAGITWTSANDRLRLIMKADDIFYTRIPTASINFKGQKSSLSTKQDTRQFSLSLIYRFGGYKERETKGVDTSRFGTN